VSEQGDRRVVNRRSLIGRIAGAGMLAIGGTVLVACGAGDQLAGATATNTTTVPTTAGTAASTVLGAPPTPRPTAPPTATARAGPLPAVSPSTESPPAPTPQATAVALAGQAAVWETVVQATKGTIVPLLRPTVLPDGIAAVRLLRAESGLFDVEYSGPGQRVRVSVGQLNPPPGAGEAPVVVRGQHVALVLHPADVPEASDWLTWREPGHWQPFGAASPEPFVEYFVFVRGVGPAEVQQVLASLAPLPLPGPPATPAPPSPVARTKCAARSHSGRLSSQGRPPPARTARQVPPCAGAPMLPVGDRSSSGRDG
jgi:hypothetical protein